MSEVSIDALIAWSESEDGARAVWHAWFEAMNHQHREVSRHRAKWDILEPQEKLLDSRIAQTLVADMLAAVASEHEVARGSG